MQTDYYPIFKVMCRTDDGAPMQTPQGCEKFDCLLGHLKSHGMLTPVFIDSNFVVVSGHYRLLAWRLLGNKKVAAVMVAGPAQALEVIWPGGC